MFVSILGALAIAAAPPAAPNDTITASPWVLTVFGTWHPAIERAWCVTSDARWTAFYFLRHIAPAPREGCDGRPMFYQLPICPNTPPAPRPAYVIVQCGPSTFAIYSRNRREISTP
jgi:hypothetical protein